MRLAKKSALLAGVLFVCFFLVWKGGEIMVFTKDSFVVNVWYGQVINGNKTLDQIPNLWNLKDVVREMLDEGAA